MLCHSDDSSHDSFGEGHQATGPSIGGIPFSSNFGNGSNELDDLLLFNGMLVIPLKGSVYRSEEIHASKKECSLDHIPVHRLSQPLN